MTNDNAMDLDLKEITSMADIDPQMTNDNALDMDPKETTVMMITDIDLKMTNDNTINFDHTETTAVTDIDPKMTNDNTMDMDHKETTSLVDVDPKMTNDHTLDIYHNETTAVTDIDPKMKNDNTMDLDHKVTTAMAEIDPKMTNDNTVDLDHKETTAVTDIDPKMTNDNKMDLDHKEETTVTDIDPKMTNDNKMDLDHKETTAVTDIDPKMTNDNTMDLGHKETTANMMDKDPKELTSKTNIDIIENTLNMDPRDTTAYIIDINQEKVQVTVAKDVDPKILTAISGLEAIETCANTKIHHVMKTTQNNMDPTKTTVKINMDHKETTANTCMDHMETAAYMDIDSIEIPANLDIDAIKMNSSSDVIIIESPTNMDINPTGFASNTDMTSILSVANLVSMNQFESTAESGLNPCIITTANVDMNPMVPTTNTDTFPKISTNTMMDYSNSLTVVSEVYSFVSASVSMQDSQMVEPNVLEPPILDMVQDSDSDNSDVIPIGGYGCMLKIRPADSTTGDKLEGKRKLKVMTVNNKEEKNSKVDYSKKHACLYCGKLDLKISRHLCKKHGNEKAIAQLPPPNQSKKAQLEQEHVLDSLRNEGDFLYNIDLLQNRNKDGEGLIVAKRPVAGEHEFNDYLPCKYCLKLYLKSELWRHAKKCKFMPAPLLELTNNYPADLEEKESRKFIKDGINILKGAGVNLKHVTTSNDKEEFYYHVLGSIQNDDIGHKLKNDEGIIMFGKSEFERLGRRRANEVRYRMRLLQRIKDIVLSLDKSVTTSNLMSLLAPDRFEFFVETVKVLVGIRKEKSLNGVVMFGKPQLAKKTGQIIRKFAEMCEGQSVVKRDREKRQEISDFMFMYTKNWSSKIGSLAHQTSVEDKFNKKDMLPLTKDLSKLQNYLDNEMPTQCELVEKCPTKENWRILSYILLTKLTLFNFRRGNEVAAMQITKFNERGDWRGSNEEIYQSLSNFEQALAKRMDLVEVMGEQNKKVPVLLTPATKAGLIQLNKFRHATEVYPENPYVFAKGKDKFIQGHEALKYVLEQVPELEQPESLKFPTMRKYLATVVHVFGMKETDVAEVARHMGHELSVHCKFYRLQDDVIELAKISKLLLAVERGKAHKYSGISLDDLDLEETLIQNWFIKVMKFHLNSYTRLEHIGKIPK
ncbi:hypothetical protein KUTeg_021887 [Tegillarca granosa]|uniref:Uncharacterized protein n=1 Tax=Tegillarca granosa TaxID=220873 RepID=A0ABQ9E4N6_TEGGR|nr:hypothetical protein KUTeg_021887 [Tegillarca granosa]